jgi:hypothetical protein
LRKIKSQVQDELIPRENYFTSHFFNAKNFHSLLVFEEVVGFENLSGETADEYDS